MRRAVACAISWGMLEAVVSVCLPDSNMHSLLLWCMAGWCSNSCKTVALGTSLVVMSVLCPAMPGGASH